MSSYKLITLNMNYRIHPEDFYPNGDRRWTAEYDNGDSDGDETIIIELMASSDGMFVNLKNVQHTPRSRHVSQGKQVLLGSPNSIATYQLQQPMIAANELLDNYLNQND